jgi:hypothetical protein
MRWGGVKMLGEQVGTFEGKTTGTRVLPGDDYRYIKMETSFEEQGTLFGMQAWNMGTMTAFERVPGQIYVEGQGIVTTSDGASAIWNAHGVSGIGEGMTMTARLSLAFQAGSDGPLARLNAVLVVAELESSMESGQSKTALWEWK